MVSDAAPAVIFWARTPAPWSACAGYSTWLKAMLLGGMIPDMPGACTRSIPSSLQVWIFVRQLLSRHFACRQLHNEVPCSFRRRANLQEPWSTRSSEVAAEQIDGFRRAPGRTKGLGGCACLVCAALCTNSSTTSRLCALQRASELQKERDRE